MAESFVVLLFIRSSFLHYTYSHCCTVYHNSICRSRFQAFSFNLQLFVLSRDRQWIYSWRFTQMNVNKWIHKKNILLHQTHCTVSSYDDICIYLSHKKGISWWNFWKKLFREFSEALRRSKLLQHVIVLKKGIENESESNCRFRKRKLFSVLLFYSNKNVSLKDALDGIAHILSRKTFSFPI